MSMPPPPPLRLHWSPVEPSWIVSAGLVVLAVLPHQVPPSGRRVLEHPLGGLLFAALSAYVAWRIPVLGAAMFIFLAGIVLHPRPKEPFTAMILNKDPVQRRHRWMNEEVLNEDPHGVQERTENPVLNFDEVMDDQVQQWHGEQELGEHPHAIQDKAVPNVPEYDDARGH